MITIVSGVPRSGTSMTMMMLDRGGIVADQDPAIHADLNPYGSFETNRLGYDLTKFAGKSVKCMVAPILFDTPVDDYKIIMPLRNAEQVILSRIKAFKMKVFPLNFDKQVEMVDRQYRFIKFVIKSRPDMKLLEIPYDDYFSKTRKVVNDISSFLEVNFNTIGAEMSVDPRSYKVRTKEEVQEYFTKPNKEFIAEAI
jgi:hypothetical protein